MLKQGNTMNKITFPLCKSGSLIAEDFGISNQPNLPTSHNNHLHEKRLAKAPPSSTNRGLKITITSPFNLQIVPNTLAEIALKEEMNSVFMSTQRTKHTMILISHIPMPSMDQIFCVEPISKEEPSKHLH
jgi:hypothetical protein